MTGEQTLVADPVAEPVSRPATGVRAWWLGGGWVAVAAFAIAQAGLLFWWAALFPGLFSPDSLDYIWQSTTGNWSSHHSVLYTSLVWVTLQLTGGVSALTLAQTMAMAAALAYVTTGLRRLGAPAWALLPAVALLVSIPPVGTLMVCVWKDVGFVIALVFLLGTLARLLARPAHTRWLLVLFAVEATLVTLFRNNGFVVVVIVAAVVVACLFRLWRWVVAATAAALAAWAAVTFALYPALGVEDGLSRVTLEAFVGDIAVAYHADPASFSAADLATMSAVAPLAHWHDSARCTSTDSTVYATGFDRDAASAHNDDLMAVWRRVLTRDPGEIIATRWCRGAIAWSVTPRGGLSKNPNPWSARSYAERDPRLAESPFRGAVVSKPLDDRLYDLAMTGVRQAGRPGLEWLAWRGATLAYVSYLVLGFAAWRRRDPRVLLLAAPILANQLSVLAVNNVQAARYMAAPYILGVLLLPMAFVARSRPVEKGENG